MSEFKARANENWQPSFGAMSGPLKRTLHAALVEEQGWICCYCNRRIDHGSSHVEHLRPSSRFPADDLEYNNLLASCRGAHPPKEGHYCGHCKADWYDERLLVSPLDPICERRFRFNDDGEIRPVGRDPGARETIRHLGLNHPKLVRLRSAAIDGYLGDCTSLSENDLLRLHARLLERDSEGRFLEFPIVLSDAIRRLLRP